MLNSIHKPVTPGMVVGIAFIYELYDQILYEVVYGVAFMLKYCMKKGQKYSMEWFILLDDFVFVGEPNPSIQPTKQMFGSCHENGCRFRAPFSKDLLFF